MGESLTEVRENKMNGGRNRKVTTSISSLAGTGGKLSIPYQLYSSLGVINPWTVKTQEDEDNYYKSLLYGCRECDRIEPSLNLCYVIGVLIMVNQNMSNIRGKHSKERGS